MIYLFRKFIKKQKRAIKAQSMRQIQLALIMSSRPLRRNILKIAEEKGVMKSITQLLANKPMVLNTNILNFI